MYQVLIVLHLKAFVLNIINVVISTNFMGLLSHTDDFDCNLRNPNLKLQNFHILT